MEVRHRTPVARRVPQVAPSVQRAAVLLISVSAIQSPVDDCHHSVGWTRGTRGSATSGHADGCLSFSLRDCDAVKGEERGLQRTATCRPVNIQVCSWGSMRADKAQSVRTCRPGSRGEQGGSCRTEGDSLRLTSCALPGLVSCFPAFSRL